jgi:heme/copper-type cytochrome/quinol oxidase subunit 4
MFGNYNASPPQSIPVTVVSAQLIIQGTIQTRLLRLTDVVNEADVASLVVLDATFMEVGSRRVVAGAAVSQVQLSDVLFLHMNQTTDSNSDMRTPKQVVRATLLAPPFTIEGQIHLSYESELKIAMAAYSGRFLPVTGARYWAYGVAEAPNQVDLLLVNHAKVHVAVASSTEWLAEAPSDTGRGPSPSGW